MAALGSDVVPLVNSSTAISSGSTKGCSPVTGSAMADANSPFVTTLAAPHAAEAVHLVVVGDHEAAGHAAEDARELLVGRAVVERRERHAGQRGAEERDGQHVGVQPEVADDLGAALLEVDGGPPGALEEIGAVMPPSWEPRTMRSGSPSAAISSSMAMCTAASRLPDVSPRRGAAWRP